MGHIMFILVWFYYFVRNGGLMILSHIYIYIYIYGVAWLIIVGSGFDDWIYGMSLLQLQLIITVYTSNSFLITNLSLYYFWISDQSLVSSLLLLSMTHSCESVACSFMTQCGLPTEHTLEHFIYCYLYIRCHGNMCSPKTVFQSGLFRVARGICSVKYCPADGHIPALRCHVTIPLCRC
jgi:hypothetical protein